MISIKSEREIELLRIAGNIVHETREYLRPFIKEGNTTKQLDLLAEEFLLIFLLVYLNIVLPQDLF